MENANHENTVELTKSARLKATTKWQRTEMSNNKNMKNV